MDIPGARPEGRADGGGEGGDPSLFWNELGSFPESDGLGLSWCVPPAPPVFRVNNVRARSTGLTFALLVDRNALYRGSRNSLQVGSFGAGSFPGGSLSSSMQDPGAGFQTAGDMGLFSSTPDERGDTFNARLPPEVLPACVCLSSRLPSSARLCHLRKSARHSPLCHAPESSQTRRCAGISPDNARGGIGYRTDWAGFV